MTIFGIKVTRRRMLILGILTFLAMVIPAVRRIIWWILPLGSGNDDIVGAIGLFLFVAALILEVFKNIIPDNPYNRKRERKL